MSSDNNIVLTSKLIYECKMIWNEVDKTAILNQIRLLPPGEDRIVLDDSQMEQLVAAFISRRMESAKSEEAAAQ